MGFYLRHSVKAGPFRFNLSKSGVGISTGVKGLRIGTGPRGTYVHMGAGGIYYRQTLSSRAGRGTRQVRRIDAPIGYRAPTIDSPVLEQVTLVNLAGNPANELAGDLNAARRKLAVNPIAWMKGQRRVPLLYEVDGSPSAAFQAVVDTFERIRASNNMWLVDAAGAVAPGYQRKVNAGATSVIQRQPAQRSVGGPKQLATNVEVPSIASKTFSLYFLPDHVVALAGKQYVAWQYDQLRLEVGTTRFIEDATVPPDASQVGQTWRFVNRDGGPDRRFKNNRALPIMSYGLVTITGPGLRLVWHVSSVAAAHAFASALSHLKRVVVALPRLTGPAASGPGAQPQALAGPAALPSAAWYPDPKGQNNWRWWDGSAWTDHVG